MAAAGHRIGACEHHYPDLIWLESVDSITSFGIRDHGFFCWSLKSISRGTYITQFFFPTLPGNVMGGLALVAALGHAQVVGGKQEQGKPN